VFAVMLMDVCRGASLTYVMLICSPSICQTFAQVCSGVFESGEMIAPFLGPSKVVIPQNVRWMSAWLRWAFYVQVCMHGVDNL